MINNPECDEPRVTVKRDKSLAMEDKVMQLEDLQDELTKRNQETDVPISILYEHKNVWSITYIDTPGLKQPDEKGAQEREALVLEYAKPYDRFLVFVEESKVQKILFPIFTFRIGNYLKWRNLLRKLTLNSTEVLLFTLNSTSN
jgi:GTPase Era involved in 16S rRNA processing